MTDAPPPGRKDEDRPDAAKAEDTGDDRNDPAMAAEIGSRHPIDSAEADPDIPTRPRAPLGPWLWVSALIAFVLVMAILVIVARI